MWKPTRKLAAWIALALLAGACAGPPSSRGALRDVRPNVVVIVSDDQGWGDVGYHDASLRTPHMDTLARTGVELDQHYVQPQCTPTRVALMTGRYPSRFGAHCTTASNQRSLPPGTPTLASMLKSRGYATALAGKWHLGSKAEWGPNHYGFDSSYGSLAGAIGMYDHRYRIGNPFEETWHRDHEFLVEEGHSTDLLAAEAVRVIEEPREEPFFLYVPFHAVHVPIVERDERWAQENAHIESPDRRAFAAALTHLDDAVGRIVAALERTGQRENTLIVFTSDNGGLRNHGGNTYPPPDPALREFSSNAPLRGQKTQAFEGGIRVPAFVSWPARLEPRVVRAPLHAVDWMPTLAALVDWTPEELPEWDGRDIWGLLAGTEVAQERRLYWRWGRAWDALRVGDWKIVRRNGQKDGKRQEGEWKLFHLAVDPYEERDLAAEQPARIQELARQFELESRSDA